MKYKRFLLFLMAVVLLFSSMMFSASAVDKYESENNNTIATADVTYDDYNNYGRISSSTDVDYWVITFPTEGMVNFFLDPGSDCDLDIYLYDAGYNLKAYSMNGLWGEYEYLRVHVYDDSTYYIKIITADAASTQNYLLRAKRYDMGVARMFTFEYTGYDTTGDVTDNQTNLWRMGYDVWDHPNNLASSAYSVLPNTGIFYFNHHGQPGRIDFRASSKIFADNCGGDYTSNDRFLSNLPANSLVNMDLMLLMGCYVGTVSEDYGNFVEIARNKGARNCITFVGSIKTLDASAWAMWFFDDLASGNTVDEAIDSANAIMEYEAIEYESISVQYVGDSITTGTTLC